MSHLELIKEACEDILEDTFEDFSEKSNFVEDLRADSLDCIEIIMYVEEKLDIEIPDDDAFEMHTVQDVLTYLKNL